LADAPAGHTLVIFADSSSADACPGDVCSLLNGGVAYHRAESVEARDAIQTFGGVHHLPVAENVRACMFTLRCIVKIAQAVRQTSLKYD
jgi:uncharacterized protein involved in type VI secretion and phage assembly